MAKDKSPLIPDLGPIQLSTLFQRRTESKELLSDSYVKFEDYDNLSLLSLESLDNHSVPELISVPQIYVTKANIDRWQWWFLFNIDYLLFFFFVIGLQEGCLWIIWSALAAAMALNRMRKSLILRGNCGISSALCKYFCVVSLLI